MGSPHPLLSQHFIKYLTVSLFLIVTSSCVCQFSSPFLTILIMVLSPSIFFAFSKRKQHQKSNLLGKSQTLAVSSESRIGKDVSKQRDEIESGGNDDHPSIGIAAVESPRLFLLSESEARDIPLDSMEHIPTSFNSTTPDDQWRGCSSHQIPVSTGASTSDDDIDRAPASPESSISDEESLIEITLSDGHPMGGDHPPKNTIFWLPNLRGLLSNFQPELVMRQQELLDLFSDVNEEDNLIEIDIAVGSVKCSAFRGIKS